MTEVLLDACCEHCTHTLQTPCAMYVECRTEGPLCHDSDECKKLIAEREKKVLGAYDIPRIAIGMGTCGIAAGAKRVKEAIEEALRQMDVTARVTGTGCIGLCQHEILVDVEAPGMPRLLYSKVTPEKAVKLVEGLRDHKLVTDSLMARLPARQGIEPEGYDEIPFLRDTPRYAKQKIIALGNCGMIDPDSLDEYLIAGGYRALSQALKKGDSADVVEQVKKSGLRGRGGAGFPTGRKWEFCRNAKGDRKFIICNADEGDPGAFMDRSVLEGDPYRVLEGMTLAAYGIGAQKGYIYVRAEYPLAVKRLQESIEQARACGLLGENILNSGFSFDLELKKGAGAFVCGEETALMASIEGQRGMPRPRPPFPANSGVFKCPTNINNVETYANIAAIIKNGGDWFASIGTERSKGTKVFAVTGKVRNTGLVEVPMGTTLREVIFDICGGMMEGKKFKAVQIGGPSGGCLPESMLDVPVDYDSLVKAGAMMGSGGLVVMDDETCMVDVAKFFLTFTQGESCGKCTPCREGTKRMLEILTRITKGRHQEEDPQECLQRFSGVMHLEELAKVIKDTALCGLGQTAPNPVLSTLHYFRDEYEAHVFDRKCPAGACRSLLTYRINPELCKGCGLCAKKCPQGAIVGEKRNAHVIVEDKCIKCGVCIHTCPFEAVYAE